ncbi:hypothetical protein H5410_049334 [Solanum commersonii]|uniref:Uncharacterized protein n=1 Tax=Solanum commersonii TaxID=4109 RepID=A0A9J5WS10_SOLCO|nr:hypothetical protein H5410_049334 [Solanum commersonii]
MADDTWPMRANHSQCHLADVHRPRPTSADRYVQATDNAARTRPTLVPNVCIPRTMLAGHVRHRLIDVCSPQMIVAGHVRRRLTVMCREQIMRASHVRR